MNSKRRSLRDGGDTKETNDQGVRSKSLRLAACGLLLVGCTVYESQPIDLQAVLLNLSAAGEESSLLVMAEPGLTPRQAAAWAVQHNPGLAEVRASLGVAEAELIEAGLLPNPQVGWDSMDVLAVKLNGGTAKTEEYLAGLGLTWELPRPGEIDAKVGVAAAREEDVRQQILTAEWQLVRAVYQAHLDVLAAQAALDLMDQQVGLAQRTADFFSAALEVGGATAIQENLAATEVAILQQEQVRLRGEAQKTRQDLNELLGVAPGTEIPLSAAETVLGVVPDSELGIDSLVTTALKARPDIARMMARYRRAEESLRLEIARQWPQISIGTGLFLELPIFTQFNQPAVRTAIARRAQLKRMVSTAVFQLRAEIHSAVSTLESSQREVAVVEEQLLPRLQRAIETTDEAFRLRELTLFEILTTQRQVLETRRLHLSAKAGLAQARILLETITGVILRDDNLDEGGER